MSSETSAIHNGAKVELFGLKANQYNGKSGICHGISESSPGRYIIEIDGKNILVKRENLKILPRDFAYAYKSPAKFKVAENAAWAVGLDKRAAAEWFIDCYRMRVDDEYALAGELRGLYNIDHNSKFDIAGDFLLYCHLALLNNVVPSDFDWKLCLGEFGHLLKFAFEKSDAQDKYGRENYFSAMMGGRSLRATGEVIYQSPCHLGGYDDHDSEERKAFRKEKKRLENAIKRLNWNNGDEALFKDVGGFELWKGLLSVLGN
ncbi:hypothetical protein HK098_007475 [Nowakowskiella sp. JEL0407]|nr:hypothetical protein HK098_007475 [Nowakowskiella sp. JEL0407]